MTTREDYIAFPSSDIEAGMKAERNVENATIGTGAASASGIETETYISTMVTPSENRRRIFKDDGSYDVRLVWRLAVMI